MDARDKGRDLYACDRRGSRFHSTRAAFIEFCPRCLLRDDAAAALKYRPDERRTDREPPAKTPATESKDARR
jgi:hypothetical protein